MAYPSLVSLAQTMDHILNHDKYRVSVEGKQKIRLIHERVVFLTDFLEDFPEKAIGLEEQIRDLANEAADMIEYFIWERTPTYYRSKNRAVWPSRFRHTGRPYDFHELKKAKKKFDSIAGKIMKIKDNLRVKDEHLVCGSSAASASSSSRFAPTYKDVMSGFDDDLAEIKSRLCGSSSRLRVIPVYGMGGIGKTTLARNAYDDPLIVDYFYVRAWVAVSQDYSAREILSGLLASMEEYNIERTQQSDELVEDKLYKSLKGRRYLIVMDDMWSTKAWDDVRNIFPDDSNGSRIMITTRLVDVAAYPDPRSPLYEMRLMDANRSWNLLRQKVFSQQECPPDKESIGKEIARGCGGLPLAIVTIAGVLCKTDVSWEKISRDVNKSVASNAHFEKILSLSYTHLPHHLRPCFLYMGGFPEDHEIRVSTLVKLWIAEGFLKYGDTSKSLEEQAEEYLEDLIKKSLIFATKMKTNGKIKSCGIHDLVRDLCIKIGHEEKFLLNAEKVIPNGKIKCCSVHDLVRSLCIRKRIKSQRRISIAHYDADCLAIFGSKVRSIRLFQCRELARNSLGKFRLLRVLDVVFSTFREPKKDSITLPDQVCNLVHLRYLALMYYIKIPSGITNLQNLQTLIIYAWKSMWYYPDYFIPRLPMGIWSMVELRHLVSFFFDLLPNVRGATPLHNLQTLSVTTNFHCSRGVLEMIPNLRKLEIFYYRANCSGDFYLEDLVYLHCLENLKIRIHADFPYREKLNPVFPRTLKKLSLSGWRVPWERLTIVGSLPNLEVLKLKDYACRGSTWETEEGEFLELRFLFIDKSDLQHWIAESSHFPRLRSLLLHRCWCLTEIPEGIGEIPTLELIEVDNGNTSLAESAKGIQEKQQSWGNDGLQLRWVHS